uniref:Uncharacterized protein n=1 Tax=Sus scrofa TaxID=9823 RepID=A0A8D2A8F7_PIG
MSVGAPEAASTEEQKEMEDKSGDYSVAKAKTKNKQSPSATQDKTEATRDHIPTWQEFPQQKPSLAASKLAG